MSVESSIVAQMTLNGDGSVRVREEHTFHTMVTRSFRYDGVEGVDYTLELPAHAAQIEAKEQARELGNLTAHLLNGLSIATFDRQHNSASAFIEPVLRAFMALTDPVQALTLAREIRDTLTNTQIDAFVPLNVRQMIRIRIANLETIEAGLLLDATHIIEVPE